MDLVSVIVPTYGRPEKLMTALRSICEQTYSFLEIVVVDDNPPESPNRALSQSICSEVEACLPSGCSLSYVPMPFNSGGSAARNAGVSKSTGRFISFLDDDDEFLPSKIERQVTHVLSEGLDISLCAMRGRVDGRDVKLAYAQPVANGLKNFLLSGNVFTPMILAKREVIEAVGGFEETPRFQDHVLMIKLLENNPRLGIMSDALFIHNIHSGDRISYTPKARLAFSIKHKFENRNSGLLTPKEKSSLAFRQSLELCVCDSNGKVSVALMGGLSKALRSKNIDEVIWCVKFLVDKFRNYLVRLPAVVGVRWIKG